MHEDQVTGPREPIPPDAVKVVLDGLEGEPDARAEFVEGLGKHLHFISVDPTPATAEAAGKFMRGWILSVMVASDPRWREQVAEHDRKIAAGDVGPSATTDDIRNALRS